MLEKFYIYNSQRKGKRLGEDYILRSKHYEQ